MAQKLLYVGDDSNYTTPKPLSSAFQTNLKSVLSWLSGDAATSKGYNHNSFGNNTPGDAAAYGLYDCRGDVAGYFCQFCVSTATSEVFQRCPSRESAIIWYDFCLLRYSNENFFGNVTVYPSWHGTGKKNVSGAEEIQKGEDFMRSLIRKATVETNQLYYMDAFNLSSSQRRYGLVQCGRDLTNHRCRQCLEALLAQVRECCEHNLGWFVGTASCLVKYDDYIFYNPPSSVSVSGSRKGETSIAFYSDVVTLFSHLNLDLPTIPLITIRKSTDDFSVASKLGQGGFGPVYKGTLPDGRQIAVKRLSQTSGQGSEEFKNEVMLIAKLQHRNLVRLLACSMEENEKILVYEYMSNSSLDFHLFDERKKRQLDWNIRLNIINGIAKGLLYLHEDSRLKVIHRI
ncbi:hypothetical protein Fmac_025332 [Flemingia macrophylla]|uniref:non-specific serine/threonine protein kinase n=1 Tax=Flemingia macrophylla TaxID=520843 RepID=A0ABD1LRX9_9FABA